MSSRDAPASAQVRPWGWLVVGIVVIGLFSVYPPFRVVSRESLVLSAETGKGEDFNPVAFAAKFWVEKLIPAASRATPLDALVGDLQRDPAAALKAHGHVVGLGSAAYYFARGGGRIIKVERDRLLVAVGGGIVAIRTGPVFGNTVRDGCGLLDVNQVPGLAEFNALSAELNRLVEERVQPALKHLAVGNSLSFAGCAEAPEAPVADGPLLTFMPVQAEVKP